MAQEITVQEKRWGYGMVMVDGVPAYCGSQPHPTLWSMREAQDFAAEIRSGMYTAEPMTIGGRECVYMRYSR